MVVWMLLVWGAFGYLSVWGFFQSPTTGAAIVAAFVIGALGLHLGRKIGRKNYDDALCTLSGLFLIFGAVLGGLIGSGFFNAL